MNRSQQSSIVADGTALSKSDAATAVYAVFSAIARPSLAKRR